MEKKEPQTTLKWNVVVTVAVPVTEKWMNEKNGEKTSDFCIIQTEKKKNKRICKRSHFSYYENKNSEIALIMDVSKWDALFAKPWTDFFFSSLKSNRIEL